MNDILNEEIHYFQSMIDHTYQVAENAHEKGIPIVGIMCEFTPREIIFAAGALPICLCGGTLDTIPTAEHELPTNVCPLIKSTYGYLLTQENPFLNWANLIVAETTCDGKKKMYELMAQQKEMFILQLPQRSDDEVARAFWRVEVERLITFLEQKFSVQITTEKLRNAVHKMNQERYLRLQLALRMQRENPPFSGSQLLEFKNILSCLDEDLAHYQKILNITKESNFSPSKNQKVRVMLTGVPTPHGAERVLHLIEACGGEIVVQENCTGIKPLLNEMDENAKDIVSEIANFYYHLPCSVMTPNHDRFKRLQQLAFSFNVDVIIELVWHACLTYDIESVRVKKFCSETLKIPYLKLNTDYSPHDDARLRVRIEALFEQIKNYPNS